MRNIIIYITICIAGIMSVLPSCKKTLDINRDPNFPGDAPVNMLLSSAELSFAGILGGNMELVGGMWSQHYTQNSSANQYNTTINYTISNTSYGAFWDIPYIHALPDLRITSKKALAEGAYNYYMASEIMTCFIYHVLACWYENVPYTEALMGDEQLNPKYEDGKLINKALIKRLDAALEKSAESMNSKIPMGKRDLVNGGDMRKWVQFGKSLKLQLLMLDFDSNRQEIEKLLAEDDFLKEDCKLDKFIDRENNSNPLYENDRRKLNTSNNIAASTTLMKFLQENKDPRIEAIYEPNKEGEYRGLDQGDRPPLTTLNFLLVSLAKIEPTDPVYFISFADLCFLKAEAFARLGKNNEAEINYNNAVIAAFSRWGYDAKPFIAKGGGIRI